MTLSYNIGLTAGSLVAYLLDAIIGPPLPGNGCKIHSHYQNRSRATLVSSVTKATHNITSTAPTTLLSSVAGATESSASNASTLLLATVTSTVIASVSQVVNMPTSESPVLNLGNGTTGFPTSLEPF